MNNWCVVRLFMVVDLLCAQFVVKYLSHCSQTIWWINKMEMRVSDSSSPFNESQ
jgi:hypothetical protein